jgi:hypothetical protein
VTVLGAIFIFSFVSLRVGVATSPDHSFHGSLANLTILGIFVTGLAPAVNAL